jgi:hypothetical protein
MRNWAAGTVSRWVQLRPLESDSAKCCSQICICTRPESFAAVGLKYVGIVCKTNGPAIEASWRFGSVKMNSVRAPGVIGAHYVRVYLPSSERRSVFTLRHSVVLTDRIWSNNHHYFTIRNVCAGDMSGKTPWPESAREPYRQNDSRVYAKLVPTFFA